MKKKNVLYRKIWKQVDDMWLPTHLKWTKAGDVFKVEGDIRSFMMVTDPIIYSDRAPTVKFIQVIK
jgi:hypothetical protein